MKKRNVAAVIILPLVTFGIYMLYWFVQTKQELNQRGAGVPTAWLLIIPFVNLYWLWKYFEGAEQVTGEKSNAVLNFVLTIFVTPLISMAICQDSYNKLAAPAAAAMPTETPAPPEPPAVEPKA
jgi:hypothetical protein